MSKYHCVICGNLIKPTDSDFFVGENVVFAVVKETTKSTKISTKTGRIEWVKEGYAGVRSGKKIFTRAFNKLHPADAPSPLTYILGKLCECEVPNHG